MDETVKREGPEAYDEFMEHNTGSKDLLVLQDIFASSDSNCLVIAYEILELPS